MEGEETQCVDLRDLQIRAKAKPPLFHARFRLFLKFRVDFHLISSDEFVGFVGHADYGHHFFEHGVGHSFILCRDGVAGDAVSALVGYADGDVDEFLGERVEGAGSDHDLLDAGPGSFQDIGLVSQGSPEIVDEVGFSGRADVVEDGFDAGTGGDFGVGEEFYSRHGKTF